MCNSLVVNIYATYRLRKYFLKYFKENFNPLSVDAVAKPGVFGRLKKRLLSFFALLRMTKKLFGTPLVTTPTNLKNGSETATAT